LKSLSVRAQIAAYSILLLVALLVGMAAHASSSSAGAPAVAPLPLIVVLQTVFWLFVAADLVVVALLVYAIWPQPRYGNKGDDGSEWVSAPPPVPWLVKVFVAMVTLVPPLGLAALLVLLHRSGKQLAPGLIPGMPAAPGGPILGSAPSAGSATGYLIWLSLGMAASLILAVAAWWWVRRRRRPERQRPTPATRDDLSGAIEESLEALRSIPNPRLAVIASYASMERAFQQAGLPRRPHEAPLEFIARVLTSIARARDDARRLTGLFELAKFSLHDVDEQMRGAAIAALSRIRDELRHVEAA
jgi:hypothetical protein